MSKPSSFLAGSLIGVLILATGTSLYSEASQWSGTQGQSQDFLTIMLGDARKLFANHFFVEADVYFHSGYYPTIFDQKKMHDGPHMVEEAGHEHHEEHEGKSHDGEDETDFLGKPRDWVDRFGRSFFVTKHTHLPAGRQREMLPWLRLAASLDPHQVENYTVSAFWLRTQLGKVDEAEQFLREGWRLNPESPEILFELGQLLYHDRKDTARARNVWELGLKYWHRREDGLKKKNEFVAEQLLANLAKLEQEARNWPAAVKRLEELQAYSPHPDSIQKQIQDLKAQHGI